MSDTQKLLQCMMWQGCMSCSAFKKLIIKIKTKGDQDPNLNIDDEALAAVINRVNEKIKPFHMELRSSIDEVSGEAYYSLISTVDNDITRLSTIYSASELDFFKALLATIVEDDDGTINMNTVKEKARPLNMTRKPKDLLEEWCQKRWIVKLLEDGRQEERVTLGARALAELDVFIKTKLLQDGTDLDCVNCRTMAIYCAHCPKCGARYHKRCFKMSYDVDEAKCQVC